MTHKRIKDRLLNFHDRELTGEERREITEHIKTCGECRLALERWELISGALRRSTLEKSSKGFVESVMERIPLPQQAIPVPRRKLVPNWLIPALGYGFAILFVFAAVSYRYPTVTTENILLADVPQASQWIFSPELPETTKLLGITKEDV
ncbi:MAG: zf-HC2 domain-containing protein [Candidatus Omnitrophica bacterium]|nr:zf-HC2 domain-containing protein [Candidatus Omnitrophota bacterium]